MGVLKGGGGWHDLDHQNSQPKGVLHTGKCAHEQVSGTGKAQDVERMAKRVKCGNGRQHGNNQESHSEATRGGSDQVIDLTHSSPAPEDTLEMESQQYLSSVEYGSGHEYEVSKSLHH